MTRTQHGATLSIIGLLLMVLAACGGSATPGVKEPTSTSEPVTARTNTPAPDSTTPPEPVAESEPTAKPTAESSLAESLLTAFPNTPQAQGEVVLIYGYVVDVNGDAVANAAVEFWQIDANGVYDHPSDPTTGDRDQTFQFYGTSVTDDDGLYYFRTISPGYYEPRPKHIHLKVKVDSKEALTLQFYFEEDRADLAGESLFRQAGDLGELLILEVADSVEVDGQVVRVLTNDLIIDTGIADAALTLTPAQGEGPHYPILNAADYDNDLTVK
ncbi:MAG: hypothetical protein GY759_09285 [Chloroflexi bacterium]|nr:hypothetical protein [Chloroflexota bacterium]